MPGQPAFLQYAAPSLQFLIAVAAFGEPFTRAHLATFACIWTALGLYSWDSWRAMRTLPPPSDSPPA